MHKNPCSSVQSCQRESGPVLALQGHVFAPPDPHAELQSVETIEAPHSFAVHEPALASQQHPDPLVPKPWSSMGEISNAQAERRLILRPTTAIPRGPTELR
jgi:hypothetical protein